MTGFIIKRSSLLVPVEIIVRRTERGRERRKKKNFRFEFDKGCKQLVIHKINPNRQFSEHTTVSCEDVHSLLRVVREIDVMKFSPILVW